VPSGSCHRRTRRLCASVLLAIGPAVATAQDATAAESATYEFGRGLQLGNSGLTLGGYATSEFREVDGKATRLKLSHASAFVWWEGLNVIKAFAEIDLRNLGESSRGADDDEVRRTSLERLYVDISIDDPLTLRVGKFLTPIGRWNLAHADPLVWTTTPPLVLNAVFPHNVTGLQVSGQAPLFGTSLGYAVYGSNGNEWHADRLQDSFSTVRGARLVLPLMPDTQLGFSYARYQQQRSRGDVRRLAGVDFLWTHARWELSAEWLRSGTPRPALLPDDDGDADDPAMPYLPFEGNVPDTKAGFVQCVAPLSGNLVAVLRYDRARLPNLPRATEQMVGGLVWRPGTGTAFKIEWLRLRNGSKGVVQGLVASASLLF
jgi:hypothetical protein